MQKSLFLVFIIALPLLIPPVVFSLCAFAEGMSFSETMSAVLGQYSVRRQNLLLSGLPGYFPILLLFGALWIYRRADGHDRTRKKMAWSGLIAITLVLVWVNLQFWPIFLPERKYPGFPHGLEFIIGPGLFAPVAMLLAIIAAWWIFREG